MRITSDGVAAAGVATKRVFDEDGAAVVSCSHMFCLFLRVWNLHAPVESRRSYLYAFSRSVSLRGFFLVTPHDKLIFVFFSFSCARIPCKLASVGVGYRQGRPLPTVHARDKEEGHHCCAKFSWHLIVSSRVFSVEPCSAHGSP